MSGAICPNFLKCARISHEPKLPECTRDDCPGARDRARVQEFVKETCEPIRSSSALHSGDSMSSGKAGQ